MRLSNFLILIAAAVSTGILIWTAIYLVALRRPRFGKVTIRKRDEGTTWGDWIVFRRWIPGSGTAHHTWAEAMRTADHRSRRRKP